MSDLNPMSWRYEIKHGPDGEADYAWVYDDQNNMVCVAKTHHAIAIVERVTIPCGIASPSYHDCPNMKEVGGGMEGERYRCAVCGKSYFLDYEDMK